MNTKIIIAIAKKDLLEVRQNRAAWLPMVIVPLIFIFVLPLSMIMLPSALGASMTSDPDMQSFFANMPLGLAQTMAGMDETQTMLVLILGYFFAPMFLIFPLMFSTVIAAESFAGERERKTMEALLYTPASDKELFLGKVAAGLTPSLVITWVSFLLYIVVLNVAAWPYFGRIWFPLPTWYPLIFWISPALALIGVSATVLISARAQTFMGAYQTSSSLVILVLALVMGQATGVLYLGVGTALLIGLVLWVAAAVLTMMAVRGFNRARLLTTSAR